MAGNTGTFLAFNGLRLELPDGTIVANDAFTLRRSLYYLQALWEVQETGSGTAMLALLDGFAEEVGVADSTLSVAQLLRVLSAFLSHQGGAMKLEGAPTLDGTTVAAMAGAATTGMFSGGSTT